jgi:methyl-accepting chemotaxis protein
MQRKKVFKNSSKEKGEKKVTTVGGKKGKRLSVRYRILFPVLLLAIIAILASLQGLTNSNHVYQKAKLISQKYLVRLETAADMEKNMQEQMRIVNGILLIDMNTSKADVEKAEQNLSQVISQMDTYIDAIMKDASAEEQELLQVFTNHYNMYSTYRDDVVSKNHEGNRAQAISNNNYIVVTSSELVFTDLEGLRVIEKSLSDGAVTELGKSYANTRVATVAIIIFSVVALGIAVLITHFSVLKPLLATGKELNRIIDEIEKGEGDLTKRVTVTGNDEIGRLAVGINKFIETLQNIIRRIDQSTLQINQVIEAVGDDVSTCNDNAQNISSALEELSATMEEVSATVTTVNENTAAVDDHVRIISDETESIHQYAQEMNDRASSLAQTAKENKQATAEMLDQIVADMQKAIQDSESVDQVNALTDEILNISKQTNLLALNASIEAARAGEAGKGFAVVADEIRLLADSSRDTANNIQQINGMVIKAVRTLSETAGDMISFTQERVLNDYDGFVQSGEQYQEDANHVSGAMSVFEDKTKELSQIMVRMTDSMDGISKAVEESANAVTSSANNTSLLVTDMNHINQSMQDSAATVEGLNQEMHVFKNF